MKNESGLVTDTGVELKIQNMAWTEATNISAFTKDQVLCQ